MEQLNESDFMWTLRQVRLVSESHERNANEAREANQGLAQAVEQLKDEIELLKAENAQKEGPNEQIISELKSISDTGTKASRGDILNRIESIISQFS